MSRSTYRPEIDGLRAIAVLAVLFFHAGFGFSGGFVGVDIFFVISGFLITGVIYQDLQTHQFSFFEFWERRIRRIFPALTVMVVVTLIAGACCLLPNEFLALGESAIAQSTLVANLHFEEKTGYFDGPADLKPLLHTWSLAVEEQFYLLLPPLLVLCRRLSRLHLILLLSVLAVTSFCWSVWGTYTFPSRAFYLLQGRAWELLLGSVLALGLPCISLSRRLCSVISWTGLGGILFACLWYDRGTRFPGANAAIPCLATALIIFANSRGLTSAGKLLATWPLVKTGRLSYSLYLWHWPVLALLRTIFEVELPFTVRLLVIALSFVLAWLSWKFVETPFRRTQNLSRRQIYGLAISCLFLVFAASWSITFTKGFPNRLSGNVKKTLKFGEVISNLEYPSKTLVPIGAELSSGQQGAFLFWGDSHAYAVSDTISNLAMVSGISGYLYWAPGAIPVPGIQRFLPGIGVPEQQKREIMEFIKSHGIQHVILAARWSSYIELSEHGNKALLAEKQMDYRTPESARRILRRGLGNMLDELKSSGVTVWLMKQVPQQDIMDPRFALARSLQFGWKTPRGITVEKYRAQQAAANGILDEFRGEHVHVLDPTVFCFDETGCSRMYSQSRSYYVDDDHLSTYGAQVLLSPMLRPVLSQISHTSNIADRSSSPELSQPIQQAAHETPTVR